MSLFHQYWILILSQDIIILLGWAFSSFKHKGRVQWTTIFNLKLALCKGILTSGFIFQFVVLVKNRNSSGFNLMNTCLQLDEPFLQFRAHSLHTSWVCDGNMRWIMAPRTKVHKLSFHYNSILSQKPFLPRYGLCCDFEVCRKCAKGWRNGSSSWRHVFINIKQELIRFLTKTQKLKLIFGIIWLCVKYCFSLHPPF